MKTYKPKRLLRKAIKATQASLDGKWKLANKNGGAQFWVCELCMFDTKYDGSCDSCPLHQHAKGAEDGGCGDAYNKWADNPTRKNFMAMRRELQATLRWLEKQLPEKRT